MLRSAEETKALEERILRMKLNSERLQRRHLEVEQDKINAAQQNALVQVVSPPGNDWVIRNRNYEFEYVDNRSQPQPSPSEGFGDGRGRGRGRGRGQQRRAWASEHDDRADDPQPPPLPRARRNAPGFEQRAGRERWAANSSPNAPANSDNMVIGNWEDPATESRRPQRRINHNQNHSVIPSKVYSNTSLEGAPPHKAKYRLAEGDGPPPDPSYSFLGDSMRDGNRPQDRRKENNRGMYRPDRGPDRSDRGPDRSDRGPDRSDRGPDRSDRGPDRSDRGPDRSDRGPDRSDRGPDRSVRGPDRSVRGPDRSVRGPDRSDRGPDRSDRRPGSWRTVVNQGKRRPPMPQQSYDEWRRERDAIDQRRINRQKTSDGHWSREWDNDKIVQNDVSPPRYSGGDTWGNGRRRYNNRFGDFLDASFEKRPRTRSNQSQLNTSGSSDSKSSEKEGTFHDQRNFKGRQPRRQFSNENHFNKSSYDSSPHENRRSPAVTMSKPLSPSARLEAARRATGPVLSTLRQYDTDVCTVTLPSSSAVCEEAGSSASKSPDKNSHTLKPTLKVSVRTDDTGKRAWIVEGVGCPDLTPQLGIHDSKKSLEVASVQKRRRQRRVITRKKRLSQSSLSKDDDSWEDLSSEEDVSFVADLPGPSKTSLETQLSAKSQDVSSGPESLDPIPAANKEEELLWEEFHPAGFQNNMTLAMVTETAYKALLSKEEGEEKPHKSESDVAEKSDDAAPKLDPILVVTEIVKAEVDCMSFTSVTTDSSLPEDINVPTKSEATCVGEVDAEELSGPVSILEIPTQKGEGLSADSPKSHVEEGVKYDQCSVETNNVDVTKETVNSRSTDSECSNDVVEQKETGAGPESRVSDGEHPERSVSDDSCEQLEEEMKSEDLKGPLVDKEDLKSAESNSGCERQEIDNVEEKSETVIGECLSKDTEALDELRGKDCESVPSSVDASNSVKIDGKDSSTLASVQECQGACNPDDKTTSDNGVTKSENTECESTSPSSEMSC